jgi:hypothetical protein
MKKTLLILCVLLPAILQAKVTVFFDDFESYSTGSGVAAQSPVWTTWSGGTSAEDAAVVDDEAYSGNQSIYVVGNTGPTDLVLPFPSDYSSGIYEFSLWMYVVSGKGAYYNLQQSAVPGVDWMFELYLDNAGGGEIAAGGAGAANVNYPVETWFETKTIVNLNDDVAEFFLDGQSIHTWTWSDGAAGNGAANEFGGVDIFAYALNAQDAEYYIDDVLLINATPTGIANANLTKAMFISPNPSGGEVTLHVNGLASSTYTLQWFDVLGNEIHQEIFQASGNLNKPMNYGFASGVYFLSLSDGVNSGIQKVIIQ